MLAAALALHLPTYLSKMSEDAFTFPFDAELTATGGFRLQGTSVYDNDRIWLNALAEKPDHVLSLLRIEGTVNCREHWPLPTQYNFLSRILTSALRSRISQLAFSWLLRFLHYDHLIPLHECSTVYCPLNREQCPEARKHVEDLVIKEVSDAVDRRLFDEGSCPEIHIVIYACGGLYSEAVLITRLLTGNLRHRFGTWEGGSRLIVSMVSRAWLPACQILHEDSEGFGAEVEKGYGSSFHKTCMGQIAALQRTVPPEVQLRFFHNILQVVDDVKGPHRKADILLAMDPGIESWQIGSAIRRGHVIKKDILVPTGRFIAAHASFDGSGKHAVNYICSPACSGAGLPASKRN